MLFIALIPIQGNFGRVEIFVRDSTTREAVAGVPMTLTASTGNEVPNPTTTVLTDPRGVAVFASLPPGAYFMKVDGAGFKPVSFNEYVLIEPGSQRRVEISVNQSATVAGRLLDTAGEPLAGSMISLLSTVYVSGKPVVRLSAGTGRVQSGTDGAFRFTDVPFGDYYVQIDNSDALDKPRAPDFARYIYYPAATAISGASRVAVRASEVSIGDIRIPNARVFKVSGTVMNPLGQASVTFYLVPADTHPATDATLLVARHRDSSSRNELFFVVFSTGDYGSKRRIQSQRNPPW